MPESRLRPTGEDGNGRRVFDARQTDAAALSLVYEAVHRAFCAYNATPERMHVEMRGGDNATPEWHKPRLVVGLECTPQLNGALDVYRSGVVGTRPDDILAALEADAAFSISSVTIRDTPSRSKGYSEESRSDDELPLSTDPNVNTVLDIEAYWNESPGFSTEPHNRTDYREKHWGDSETHPDVARHSNVVDVADDDDETERESDNYYDVTGNVTVAFDALAFLEESIYDPDDE